MRQITLLNTQFVEQGFTTMQLASEWTYLNNVYGNQNIIVFNGWKPPVSGNCGTSREYDKY